MGMYDVLGVSSQNIVALCDVDTERAQEMRAKFPKAQYFQDFRKMLEQVKDIDAVTVTTPDHNHAAVALAAIGMGKHVRVQKPLAHSIYEVRKLTDAAKRQGVVLQMGNQGHAGEGTRLICEWIWGGAIGEVREVWIWTDRPIWPQGLPRPRETPPVPPGLDWDIWLGPAPARPYNPAYAPFYWRGWFDFGTGVMGDHGCHAMDASFWALELGTPESVEVESMGGMTDDSWPLWSIINFQFAARGKRPPVKLTWYDGNMRPPCPPELKEEGRDLVGIRDIGGQLIIGDKGKIMADAYGNGARIIPEKKMKEAMENMPPKILPRSPGAYEEWIAACKGIKIPTMSDADYAGRLTETVLLGNLAVRTGKRIVYDPRRMRAIGCPEADQYIHPEFRPGWGL